jgi:hypothetical protein
MLQSEHYFLFQRPNKKLRNPDTSVLTDWDGLCLELGADIVTLSSGAVPAFGTDKTCPRLTASASPGWGRFRFASHHLSIDHA